MNRRIGGPGGGSDPGPKKAAPFVAAAVLAGSVAATGGGIGAGTASLGTTTSTGAAHSGANQVIKMRKFEGKRAARAGKAAEAWKRMGLRRSRESFDDQVECVTHSFGEVREFFVRNPCRSLEQALYGVGDGAGNVAAVSVSAVTMPSRNQVWTFKRLIDTHGTGDITPLGGPLLKAYDVRFTGHHYDSRTQGKRLVVAEAEAVSGQLSGDALDAIAEVAALLPLPKR
ncbi:hypothetical protein [Saccharopolyspora cebuensis]|uniref:Secreted protein n=1 Tax=Saccharopolyspora cebuensis TaxID=418759 RepID=A0ABV4CFZ4_9PSEU